MESWSFAEGDEIVPGRRAVRLLGGGVRYEAYLAWDERLRALVVVKLLRPDRTEEPGALHGLRGEAALLERLAHPLLVRGFGAGLEGERPHVVLEFIEGPRLSTLSRRFGLSLEQVLPLALNLASVLHYLAEERVVHLDVKPRNVVMGGSPRLIDLSVAMGFDQLADIRRPVGTDAYMAPEQCMPPGLGAPGPASDVWGIGGTLLRAATGARPFRKGERESKVPSERWPQLTEPHAPLPRDLDPAVAAAIGGCLRFDPAARPSATELEAMLAPTAEAGPI
jgi:eukaryotic-like serine/threonine-protein kinase